MLELSWKELDVGDEPAVFEGVGSILSRRQLLRRGTVALGGFAGAGLLDPSVVLARANPGPRPIPGGVDMNGKPVPKDPLVHVVFPGIGWEMSTMTDFTGVIAGSQVRGTADGSDGTAFDFDTDMRFMQGTYVSIDGRLRKGAFGFI